MDSAKIFAVVLIAAGILALVYGGFSYTKSTQEAHVGPIALTVKDKKYVNVPIWAGAGAIVIGGVLLFVRSKKA
jgi:TRAP-type C4-dicarboxylate transport system permease small subunit